MSNTSQTRTAFGTVIAELAAMCPTAIAVTSGSDTLTWSELESSTNRLARAYAKLGVTAGSFVTIGLPNGVEFFQSALATWKLGAIPQPVSSKLPPRELDAIVTIVSPTLIVGLATSKAWRCIPVGFIPDDSLPDTPLPPVIASSLKAPTSGGSTGIPKVIVSTHQACVEDVAPYSGLLGMNPGGVALITGPMSHNGPFLSATVALLLGCHVVVMPRFDAEKALQLVEQHEVTWMYTVPTILHRFSRLDPSARDESDLSSLETVITMAAACPQWLKEFCVGWLGAERLVEVFAATESHAVTRIDGHGWIERPGSVGKVVVGEIQIRDSDDNELPPGEVGQLWMRRDASESGPYRYLGADPVSAPEGWETVGDMGHFDQDSYLYLADRKADMVTVGGANVYPAEVEGALEEHPAVDSAVVVGIPDEDFGNILHAVVHTNTTVSDDVLLTHLRERLVTYKLPRSFGRSERPLRDDAGKVRRNQIREQRISDLAGINHS